MSFPGRSKAKLFGCLSCDCVVCTDADCSPRGEPVTAEEWERHIGPKPVDWGRSGSAHEAETGEGQ